MGAIVRKVVAVLAVVVAIAIAAGLASGSIALVTTHGISMAPRIAADDLVVVRRGSYDIGDAVAYRSPELQQLVLHRIIARDGHDFVFQGDNNDFIDPERLPVEAIVGEELLHVPGGGRWLELLSSRLLLVVAVILILASGGGAATVQRRRRQDRRIMSDHPASTPTPRVPLPARARALLEHVTALGDPWRQLTAAVAVIGLTGVLLAVVSWTQPTATDGGPRTLEGTFGLSYTAVGAGGITTAPQPISWAGDQHVDLDLQYQGPVGTLTLDAEVMTADGRHATLQLVEPTPTTGTHDAVVPLDLRRLWALAEDQTAAAVDQVEVRLVPRVMLDTGGQLAAEMGLAMDLLTARFSHVGPATDAPDLTATAGDTPLDVAVSVTTPTRTPATITLLGRSMAVGTARVVSLAALLLAAAAVAGLTLHLRGRGPLTEADRIARRHRDLLLAVLPITTRGDGRLVEVADVAALARLAESYGVPILHWSRSGVDTYLVEDDDTTYRYRTGAVVPAARPGAPRGSWSTESTRLPEPAAATTRGSGRA